MWCCDSPEFGGSEIDMIRVLRALDVRDVVAVTGAVVPIQMEVLYADLGVKRYVCDALPSFRQAPQAIANALALIRRFGHVPYVVWAHHFDSNRWLQLMLALAGRSFVVAERLSPVNRAAFRRSRLTLPIKRVVERKALKMVLTGPSQLSSYASLFGISREKLSCIPNARDVDHIGRTVAQLRRDRRAIRARLRLPEVGPMVVTIGRLADQKDHRTIIRAIVKLRTEFAIPIILAVVGEGPDRPLLESEAGPLLDNAVFLPGFQADPLPWLAAADLFVLMTRAEGLSGAVVEAMASSLPCIVSDIAANRDLIADDETGLLVPVGNARCLAQRVRELISDPERAERLGRRAHKRVAGAHDVVSERMAWRELVNELYRASAEHNISATSATPAT
jgi:glycosyltransferase involved in cell wall biosynthesis